VRRLVAAAFGLAFLLVAAPAPATVGVPDEYRLVSDRVLADGVEHATLAGTGRNAQQVNVARIDSSAPVVLRPVVSGGDVAGGKEGLERTSAMCARIRCIVAVNADFYSEADGQPIGGMVRLGELVRSPNPKHHQLTLDAAGDLLAGTVAWSGRLVATDLSEIALDGVNIERAADKLVLYTPAYGVATGSNRHGVELIAEIVRPAPPIRLGQTAVVHLSRFLAGGNTPIPRDGIVLSGHGRGARALADLWHRVSEGKAGAEVLLRLEGEPDAVESVGGTPILVHEGKRWFSDEPRDFFSKRHPRTAVGWNEAGDIWLVTVDGRQPGFSEGMTMRELADLMMKLGATEAINLDGGGSTTFVSRSVVVNRPSDRVVVRRGLEQIVRQSNPGERVLSSVERPVASALAIVPVGDTTHGGAAPAVLPSDLGKAQTVPLPSRSAPDPASVPDAALPALIDPVPSGRRIPIAAVSLAANLVLGAAILIRRFRPSER
jgi:phosphodiester glycosidase